MNLGDLRAALEQRGRFRTQLQDAVHELLAGRPVNSDSAAVAARIVTFATSHQNDALESLGSASIEPGASETSALIASIPPGVATR